MKILIVALAFVALATADVSLEEAKKKAQDHIQACIGETGITEEVAKQYKAGEFTNREHNAQCFVKCFFQKAGFMDNIGKILPELIITKLKNKVEIKEDIFTDVINKCVKEKGEDDCSTAFKVYECYKKNVKFSY